MRLNPLSGVQYRRRDVQMYECNRCGEKYQSGSRYSTIEYCGTCIFINGNPDEEKGAPPTTRSSLTYQSESVDQTDVGEVTD